MPEAGVLDRPQILTRYMNVVPHARNMNGFDDPARYYFGVGVRDLDLAEAALLVGMLPERAKQSRSAEESLRRLSQRHRRASAHARPTEDYGSAGREGSGRA